MMGFDESAKGAGRFLDNDNSAMLGWIPPHVICLSLFFFPANQKKSIKKRKVHVYTRICSRCCNEISLLLNSNQKELWS